VGQLLKRLIVCNSKRASEHRGSGRQDHREWDLERGRNCRKRKHFRKSQSRLRRMLACLPSEVLPSLLYIASTSSWSTCRTKRGRSTSPRQNNNGWGATISRNLLPRGTRFPIKGRGQIATLTRRSTRGHTQLSEANCGRLGAEDGINILEECGSNNPVRVSSAITDT